jgi:large subunit ribosomal protein L13
MNTEKKIYNIDAANGKIGRIAAKAATLLTGKNLTSYAKNKIANVQVIIENVSKLDISEKKAVQRKHTEAILVILEVFLKREWNK